MTADEAVSIGQDALIWLAGQPEALAGFLAASGLAPEDLRSRAADPEFLGFVLEFLLGCRLHAPGLRLRIRHLPRRPRPGARRAAGRHGAQLDVIRAPRSHPPRESHPFTINPPRR